MRYIRMRILFWVVATLGGAFLGAILGALTIVGVIRRRIDKKVGVLKKENYTAEEYAKLKAIVAEAEKTYKRRNKGKTIRKIFGLKAKKNEEAMSGMEDGLQERLCGRIHSG